MPLPPPSQAPTVASVKVEHGEAPIPLALPIISFCLAGDWVEAVTTLKWQREDAETLCRLVCGGIQRRVVYLAISRTKYLNLAFDVHFAVSRLLGRLEKLASLACREDDAICLLVKEMLSPNLTDKFAACLIRLKRELFRNKPEVDVGFIPGYSRQQLGT